MVTDMLIHYLSIDKAENNACYFCLKTEDCQQCSGEGSVSTSFLSAPMAFDVNNCPPGTTVTSESSFELMWEYDLSKDTK